MLIRLSTEIRLRTEIREIAKMDTTIMAPTIRLIMLLKRESDIEAQQEQAAAKLNAEAALFILPLIFAMIFAPFNLMRESF